VKNPENAGAEKKQYFYDCLPLQPKEGLGGPPANASWSHSEEQSDEESREYPLHIIRHDSLDSSLRALSKATALRSE
jgi:hypothetical protein